MKKAWHYLGKGVWARWLASSTTAALAALAVVIVGCSVVKHETVATKSVIESLAGMGGKRDDTNAVVVLQSEVMRGADLYVGVVAQAADDFRARLATPEAREAAQQWKLMEGAAAYINASGENPVVSAVDMLILASVSCRVVEEYWVGQRFGEAARPLLEVHRRLESNIWGVVEGVLTPTQLEEIREILGEYKRRFPELRNVAAARLPELVEKLGRARTGEEARQPSSLLNLLYVNPLAGLDPTTQAIQQTRLLAERITYYAQRAPMLWSWQAELLTYQLADQPETRGVLSNLNEVAQSTKVFARTAEGLPQLVNDQRQAAIDQIFERLAVERTNLLADLASQETRLRGLLGEARQTLQAGGQMADSVNAAIKSLDAFVQYVSPPETNAAPAPSGTNSHPFNVLDYGTAATQVGAMARDLNLLLTSVNQSAPQVARMSEQAGTDLERVVHRAFWLGLVLIGVLLVGAVLAGLAYRVLVDRLKRGGAITTNVTVK